MLQEHARKAISEYGAVQRFDIVDSRQVGGSLMRVTALSIGADYPLRWRFYFYKSTGDWRLLDLRVDDGLAGMFDPDAVDSAPALERADSESASPSLREN
jgi:hypothetical protein